MKLLIEISDTVYEHAKETSEDSRDEFNAMRAIANGIQQESSSENPNTCGDAVSRQAVLDLMRGLTRWCVRSEDGKWNNVGLLYDDVMFGIDRLPSVTPQQRTGRWIPVSERLPEKRGDYLVTQKAVFPGHVFRSIASYATNLHNVDEYDFKDEKRPGWYEYDSEWGYRELDDVIAWMPLVEPYRAESEEV